MDEWLRAEPGAESVDTDTVEEDDDEDDDDVDKGEASENTALNGKEGGAGSDDASSEGELRMVLPA